MIVYGFIGFAAQAWVAAARKAGRADLWPPFFLVSGAQLVVLLALVYFHVHSLGPILEPVVHALGGEEATHYPEHFWALPEMVRHLDAIIGVLLGAFAVAVATERFAGGVGAWWSAFRRAPALITLALLGPGVAWGITTLFDLIPPEFALRSFIVQVGLQGIELGIILLIRAILAYAVAFTVLAGFPLGRAIADSWRLALRLPVPTLILVAVPAVILFPPTFFLFEMDPSQSGLIPESVGMLLFVMLVLRTGLDFLTVGAITHVFLRTTAARS